MSLKSIFSGTCCITLSGENINRFIHVCDKHNIYFVLNRVSKTDILITIHPKDKSKIFSFAEKLSLTYKINKEKGIPILYLRYKIRYWILLFILLTLGLLWKFSHYIWNIDVTGTSNYTTEQIKKYVTAYEVPLGTKKSDVSCFELEKNLRMKYNELGWINCYITGTKLTIEVLETITPTNTKKNLKPCNIVSVKDATIKEAIATEGHVLVEAGTTVKKGDVLITGVTPIYNDYGEELGTSYIPANGTIYGYVTYEYQDSFNLNQIKKTPVKEKVSNSIILGSFELKLPTHKSKDGNSIKEYKQLKLGKTYYLPITICQTKSIEYEEVKIKIDDKEACAQANKKLQGYIADLRKKGVEIVQNNVKILIENDRCIARGQILCIEQIGIAVPVDCETQGEE